MKTKNQKQSKTKKFMKALLFVGAIGAITVYAINDQGSLAEKYTINTASFEDKSGYEMSYINLTGKETIADRKIQLSEDYWTRGKLGF